MNYDKQETITIVCRYTGIQADITLPKVGNLTLEYTHPLSHVGSALEASNRQDFMRRLDAPVLSGILITLLRSSKLLANSKEHAGTVNLNLSKASKAHLIKAIELVRRHFIHLEKTSFLPKITFGFYESKGDANRALESTIGTLTAELLNDSSLVDQVKNYFRAHVKATTFDGYSRQIALENAKEADAIRREARQAEYDRKADAALRKAKEEQAAKEGMLTKRERAQKTKLIVQADNTLISAKGIAVLKSACKQSELLPASKLTALSARIEELLEEHSEHEPTREVLMAAQSIFTHYLKVHSQSTFSLEEELMGIDTVHGIKETVSKEAVGPSLGDAQQAEYQEAELPKPTTQTRSLLERLKAKKAATSK